MAAKNPSENPMLAQHNYGMFNFMKRDPRFEQMMSMTRMAAHPMNRPMTPPSLLPPMNPMSAPNASQFQNPFVSANPAAGPMQTPSFF